MQTVGYETTRKGLARLARTADQIHVCDGHPSSFEDVAKLAIATKTGTVGKMVFLSVDGSVKTAPTGQMFATRKGRPTHWAITTTEGLYATGTIARFDNPVNAGDVVELSTIVIRKGHKFKVVA